MEFKYEKKNYTDEELIEIAKKRIKTKRELFSHIAAYVFVNAFLIFLYGFTNNFDYTADSYPWFLWVLAGWGLGLLFHIFESIQELNFKLNSNAVNRELAKIKKQMKDD